MTDPVFDNTIYRTMISDGQRIFPISTILHQGRIWFVPQWLVNDDEGWQTPAHIIGPDNKQLQDLRGKGQPADFALNAVIPKSDYEALCQGKTVPGWTVIHQPAVRFPKQPAIH